MDGVWIIGALGILGAIATVVGWMQGRDRLIDLGCVSHQWIAEHRLSQTQDAQR